MNVTIEIDLESAACLWGDRWEEKGLSIEKIVTDLVMEGASKYRRAFPGDLSGLKRRFAECYRVESDGV